MGIEVSEIIQNIPIDEYISQYIDGEYEHRGGELWCISPLNPTERTPSFSINTNIQTFYDFSTGRGGNLVEFVILHDKVDVKTAVGILKKYANINESGEEGVARRLEATKIARKYRPDTRKKAVMTAKPLPEGCMDRFEFDKSKLKIWYDEGISYEVMREFGVAYDRLDNRIVYPIKDYSGNIVSICARTLEKDFKERGIRKYTYLQAIGTLDTIYNYYDSKEFLLEKKEFILFEGAKSCMKAYQWGYKNTGALLTSHLSPNQCRFLIRMANINRVRIVFALDSDIDISKDSQIKMLKKYTQVEWIKNRNNLLDPKDSPADKGKDVFEKLYHTREKFV